VSKVYRIHPAIGVARVGNSPTDFYVGPDTVGGLPLECDANGNMACDPHGKPRVVRTFKDAEGRVKRQAARFRVFAYDSERPDDAGTEAVIGDGGIASITWTVHLANKKAAWWNFAEQFGDLAYGDWNSYENQLAYQNAHPNLRAWVSWRNGSIQGTDRQQLIIDPGPRSVDVRNRTASFSASTIPPASASGGYPHGTFPPSGLTPGTITSLGDLAMDSGGALLVLGAFGKAGGPSFNITGFGGADGWYDDVSDGPVNAVVHLADGSQVDADGAWAIVGSPKFAPELVNIVTLDDLIYDASIREKGLNPAIHDGNTFNVDYRPDYERDIRPLFDRPAGYRWVSMNPFLNSFSPPPFDTKDGSEANRANRERYAAYFRKPVPPKRYATQEQANAAFTVDGGPNFMFVDGTSVNPMGSRPVPMIPLNAGSDPLANGLLVKFLTVTPTQHFFLTQWAAGKFDVTEHPVPAEPAVTAEDRAVLGNCVGGPLSPGIETTWIMQNAAIYRAPYRIKPAHDENYYAQSGLSPDADEGTGAGCEPGDLTKRMAIPWQADFFDCSIQYVNYSDPTVNKDVPTSTPVPPTYYVYWWPPQSPEFTMANPLTAEAQSNSGVNPGMQVPYARGINTFGQMIIAWQYLGFVVNQNVTDPEYPYFTEQERADNKFAVGVVGVGDVNVMGGNYSINPAGTYVSFYYLLKDVYDL
jgi:hypothetical protein